MRKFQGEKKTKFSWLQSATSPLDVNKFNVFQLFSQNNEGTKKAMM